MRVGINTVCYQPWVIFFRFYSSLACLLFLLFPNLPLLQPIIIPLFLCARSVVKDEELFWLCRNKSREL